MELTFVPSGIVQIDNARLIWKNFEGRKSKFNQAGDRDFNVVIPTQEQADMLLNDTNKYGVGWNVRIRAPREEGESPLMTLKVKIGRFNERGPFIYLVSGQNKVRLTEDTVQCLDTMDIRYVNMDIRPYDGEGAQGPFRSAYLHAMEVYQNVNRFEPRFSEEY